MSLVLCCYPLIKTRTDAICAVLLHPLFYKGMLKLESQTKLGSGGDEYLDN